MVGPKETIIPLLSNRYPIIQPLSHYYSIIIQPLSYYPTIVIQPLSHYHPIIILCVPPQQEFLACHPGALGPPQCSRVRGCHPSPVSLLPNRPTPTGSCSSVLDGQCIEMYRNVVSADSHCLQLHKQSHFKFKFQTSLVLDRFRML